MSFFCPERISYLLLPQSWHSQNQLQILMGADHTGWAHRLTRSFTKLEHLWEGGETQNWEWPHLGGFQKNVSENQERAYRYYGVSCAHKAHISLYLGLCKCHGFHQADIPFPWDWEGSVDIGRHMLPFWSSSPHAYHGRGSVVLEPMEVMGSFLYSQLSFFLSASGWGSLRRWVLLCGSERGS